MYSLCPDVALWDFLEGRQVVSLSSVSLLGLRDVSKDGLVAVDASLQIYDLDTGALKLHVASAGPDQDFTFVRLTYDSQCVVWVDRLSVKVARVSDGVLIADICTHERPTSLCVLDCGYLLVVGREDGRILMMRLLPDDAGQHFSPHTAEERCSILHSRRTCSKANFDVEYQCAVQSVRDSELVRASESVRSILTQRAKAPLLSTATNKPTDATTERYRRSYSHLLVLPSELVFQHIHRVTKKLTFFILL